MGYGTYVKAGLYFSRQNYDSIEEVEDKIQEYDNCINDIKSKILLMQSSNQIIPQNWKNEPITWIKNMYDDLLEDLEDRIVTKYRLQLLLDNFNTKKFDGY